jgi:hypothetical protein
MAENFNHGYASRRRRLEEFLIEIRMSLVTLAPVRHHLVLLERTMSHIRQRTIGYNVQPAQAVRSGGRCVQGLRFRLAIPGRKWFRPALL